ncbi:hypothetical protein EWM64_g3412 [Hericium alpestre]|uniref:Sodium/calcium exchanger membrane region domain-containing protein n=1 Tax=Hericium alpestre TaxID=135208 RepID=A0A4Z0A0M1_9AGAM|nr:hypothetical protein EWM64_g3412 [Hericium alpestre]
MPLEKLFDWGGEQLAMYCGEDLGDLIIITLNNAVEATLAIILLIKCELKLLQATIAGVVLLHLLLIPGTAFMVGGARVWEQTLHPTKAELNHTLLTIGILVLLVPAGFFAAIDRGMPVPNTDGTDPVLNDIVRDDFLKMGRGFAVILLFVYVCSRFYLHDPPGEGPFQPHLNGPEGLIKKERELLEAEPDINPWACIVLLLVCVGLMGVTAEFLVDSVEFVREEGHISEEQVSPPTLVWRDANAGLDGAVTLTYFAHSTLKQYFNLADAEQPTTIAEARAMELSIQFLLFWMPFLVLLGWWAGKPLSVLFDLFEVTVLVGSCFLVNYVTADNKTNWAEGTMMISLYLMIALSAWFYPGQPEVRILDACTSIADALVSSVGQAE